VIERLILFGGQGDLTRRYLLPALAELFEHDRLTDRFSVVACARRDGETERYRRWARDMLGEHASAVAEHGRDRLVNALTYARADATSVADVRRVIGEGHEPLVVYLGLPPETYPATVDALAAASLPKGSRVVVEKPFGTDGDAAVALNEALHTAFDERDVSRVDHFLGWQTVQNIIGIRFANRIFEPLWTREHVERVEIVWDETLALEGRAGYYDGTGALRDMIQNHLLQLLCLVAMEPPATLEERDLRDRKVEVLRAVRRLGRDEVVAATRRARYGAETVGDRRLPAYVDEAGVDPARATETFAEVELTIDNWRWSGVPFVLRTGKALAAVRKEVVVRFRPVPRLAFGAGPQPASNTLRISFDPERVALGVSFSGPGEPQTIVDAELDAVLAPSPISAYGQVILDALAGDQTRTIRDDEAVESWRIVEPVLDAWAEGLVPLEEYPAGSSGPASSRFERPPSG
jgi:glucose-6-phosphate 1-dehydrogenase